MPGQTNERAFEIYVEEILLTRGGWRSGSNAEWDKERALFPAQVFAFPGEGQTLRWIPVDVNARSTGIVRLHLPGAAQRRPATRVGTFKGVVPERRGIGDPGRTDMAGAAGELRNADVAGLCNAKPTQ